jgi:hypothetical protein
LYGGRGGGVGVVVRLACVTLVDDSEKIFWGLVIDGT